MNKCIMIGRLTKDPEVRYTQSRNGEQMAVARFTIAVDRRFAKEGETSADFFTCTAFGKLGEFAEKSLKKGTKILLTGRIQNDNYTNKNGEKVYSTQIMVDEMEFAESKKSEGQPKQEEQPRQKEDEFLAIPEGIENDLPFK